MARTEWTRVAAAAALGAGILGASLAGRAEERPEAMNRVSFSVTREAEVDNDRATAVLAITDEDADAAELADRVNRTMAWGLEKARGVAAVKPRSGSYQTFPISREGKLRHWRARQELVLESADLAALTRLVGTLQSRLELASIGFSASPERRRQTEDALIAEALAGFGERAEIVRKALNASRYEIVTLSIDSGHRTPVPRPRMEMATQRAEVAPPALEAGTSRVVVSATGTIQLE